MSNQRPSTRDFFEDVKRVLHQDDPKDEIAYENLPDAPTNGQLVDMESAEFALRHTAAVCLGPDHSMYFHNFTNGRKVGAQLRTIAEECHTVLANQVDNPFKVRADVRGVYTTAFIYARDQRSLGRILERHTSMVLSQNRTLAA